MKATDKSRPLKEQTFFEDPAIDRLVGTVMVLATNHFVLLQRVRDLEKLLTASGVVDESALESFDASNDRRSELHADATAFTNSLLRPMLGIQDAVGPTGD